MNTLKQISKFAGFGYLVIFVTGFFSNFFVLENMIVPGNAADTVINITTNNILFRAGILGFIVMVIFDVILAWALYLLYEPVNKRLSLLSGLLRLVNSTIFAVALYKLFSVLHIVHAEAYLNVFDSSQLEASVLFLFKAFNDIWLIGLIFFGLHLYVLGYLIFKSGYTPKFIGLLLIIAAFGYLIDSFANFLLPSYEEYKSLFLLIVIIPGVIGELSLTLWLLFKGVPEKK